MKEKHYKNRRRLRLIPLILGIYGGFLGFGLMAIGIAEIREGVGIVRLLFGLGLAGFGLLGIWDGVRDLVRPDQKPVEPAVSQFILTDISGNRSSNVTMERLREQLKSLMENDGAAIIKLEILPSLTVQDLGKLNHIFCMYHNDLLLTAFLDVAEGGYETYHISVGQSRAEGWFEKLLTGRPDFSEWEKTENNPLWENSAYEEEEGSLEEEGGLEEADDLEEADGLEKADGSEETDETIEPPVGSKKEEASPEEIKAWGNQLLNQKHKGMAYWHKYLVIFGESWHDEHKFFSARDVELAIEGVHKGKYQKVVLEWGVQAFNLFPGLQNELMVIWRANNTGRGDTRFLAREGTEAQVKFWLINYLDRGFFEELSGWTDITAQIEKETKKVEKRHGGSN